MGAGVLVDVGGVADGGLTALGLGGALSSAFAADLAGGSACGTAENSSSTRAFSTGMVCGLELRDSSAIAAITRSGAITVCVWLCVEVTGPSHRPCPDEAMTSAHKSVGGCVGVSEGNHQ